MATHITQIDDVLDGVTILRVEGEMMGSDATLVTRIAQELRDNSGNSVTIDLADLDFLDSDAASILKSGESELDFDIVGMEIFLQTVVNQAEKR